MRVTLREVENVSRTPRGTGKKHLCTEASLNLLVLDVHPRNQPTGVTDEWDLCTFHIENSGPGAGESAVNERTPTNPALIAGGRQSEPFPYSTAVVEGHPGGAKNLSSGDAHGWFWLKVRDDKN